MHVLKLETINLTQNAYSMNAMMEWMINIFYWTNICMLTPATTNKHYKTQLS